MAAAGCAFDLPTGPAPATPDAADDAIIASGGCTDSDGDGACDVQTWTCGSAPAAPADPMLLARDLGDPRPRADATITQVAPVRVVARASATLTFGLAIQLAVDCHDKVCGVQVEYGLAGQGRAGCALDDARFDQWSAQGPVTAPVPIPATPGVYELRANLGFNDTCGTGATWYIAEPGATATFAHVCVP